MALLLSSVCLSVLPKSEQRTLARRMSAPGLTSEAQLRYILQWFGEFSELQREDFLPVLAAAKGDKPDQLAASLANISCDDKPVSLFQCRIKLFNEWYPTWAEEEQDRLVKEVSEADPQFGAKLQNYMQNGPQVNGDVFAMVEVKVTAAQNGTGESHSPPPEEDKTEKVESWPVEDYEEPTGEETADETPVVSENIPVEIATAS